MAASDHETVFTLEATPIKFGPGAAADAGWELKRLGVERALLVTDPGVRALGHPRPHQGADRARRHRGRRLRPARVEPTVESFQDARDFALEHEGRRLRLGRGRLEHRHGQGRQPDHRHPAPVIDYVNPPVGGGRSRRRRCARTWRSRRRPGTGSEATTVAVLDIPDQKVKSGISHRYLRPTQGIVDPELVRTLPAEVTTATGLDVVCHAAESYLARPYDQREAPRPRRPAAVPGLEPGGRRVVGQGARVRRELPAPRRRGRRRPRGARRDDARGEMAGVGFGSAGVHIPHACAYPIAASSTSTSRPATPTTTRSSRTGTR